MAPIRKPNTKKIHQQLTPGKKLETSKEVISGQLKKKMPHGKPESQHLRKDRGIVFIKHLPHGFFESQLRQYFKQFGRVLRVRLGRSPRTGGSKGFAFVEFEYPEVAKVAADTMDNYLMFQKVVKASYIPPEKQIYNYFKTSVKKVPNKAGKQIYVSEITAATQRTVKKQNNWNESACQKRTVGDLSKLRKLNEKYKHLGINFNSLLVKPESKSNEIEVESSSSLASAKSNKKQRRANNRLNLEDLLGNIEDDSEDKDYINASDSDEELNDEYATDEDLSDGEEEQELPFSPKELKKIKSSEKADHLLKRKPGTGGIQKKKSILKIASTKSSNESTQVLQLSTAKQLAQPLKKLKAKKLKQ